MLVFKNNKVYDTHGAYEAEVTSLQFLNGKIYGTRVQHQPAKYIPACKTPGYKRKEIHYKARTVSDNRLLLTEQEYRDIVKYFKNFKEFKRG